MPIACDPAETLWISLMLDKDKPDDSRPEFECHYLTASEVRTVRSLIDKAITAEDDDKSQPLIEQAIMVGVDGWRNITDRAGEPIEFSTEALTDTLTVNEMFELAGKSVGATALSEIDRKKFVSQCLSDTASSANAATVDNAETTDETESTS